MTEQPQDGDGRPEPISASELTAKYAEYWRRNIRYVGILLTIWFVVSYLCGIVFAGPLNAISIGGFPLGFWFAQQGSIYVFVVLIFVYVKLMNDLDREFDVQEGDAA